MHSAKLRSRNNRGPLSLKEGDEFLDADPHIDSRPSTQDSKRSAYSRLSTDSGAGSLDDVNNRRNSSPDFWRDPLGRRHTAPSRKLLSPDINDDGFVRPSTVHAWGACSPRCSLSRYAPLPAIGTQPDCPRRVRRHCFMESPDVDVTSETKSNGDVNDNKPSSQVQESSRVPIFSLTLDSDTDSDFEEESETVEQCGSDHEESEEKIRKPLIRSATFTIEKERPEVRGPLLSVAVRLPDGTRVTDKFSCKDTLASVCEFALSKSESIELKNCSLVTTDIPKRTFKDMTMSLKDARIDDKTLLYLQVSDDSDSD